ncbi:MAG: hypothetical protein PHI46_04355, partial [Bacteroidales bacterium]|nr:hypothetical protein [Bacteroidales bacterium]
TVEPSIDGDYIFDLEFVISSVAPVSEEKPEPPVKKEPEPEPADTLAAPVAKPAVKPVTPPADTVAVPVVIPAETRPVPAPEISEPTGYRLQFLVLNEPLDAGSRHFSRLTERIPVLRISVIQGGDGRYYYVSQRFSTRREALHWMRLINGMG